MSVLVNPFSFAAGGNDALTTLLLHLNGVNGSTIVTDSSLTGATVTANGNFTISTAISKFGGASGLFDQANSSYLSIADAAGLRMGNGNFTMDWWASINNAGFSPFWWKGNGGVDMYILMRDDRSLTVGFNNSAFPLSLAPNAFLTDSAWHHYALVRNGTSVVFYRDGVSKATGTNSPVTNMTGTGVIQIGASFSPEQNFLDGSIDEFRVSKGIARWTTNFTPPTQAYS